MGNLFESGVVVDDGAVYETVKVTSTVKRKLLDVQDDRRRRTGRRPTMSALIDDALDAFSGNKGAAAQPTGVDATTAIAEVAKGYQEYGRLLVSLAAEVHSVMQQLERLGIAPQHEGEESASAR